MLLLLACAPPDPVLASGALLLDADGRLTAPEGEVQFPGAPLRRAACPSGESCLVRSGPAWIEWWVPLSNGFEQGFTVAEGGQELEIAVPVEGATPRAVGPREVRLGAFRYKDLRAWDADGRALPAWLRVEGQQIALHVDASDARYPVTIDPSVVIDWHVESSTYQQVGALGDVNGDGLGDLGVVSASGSGVSWYFSISEYLGAIGGPSTTATVSEVASYGSGKDAIGELASAGDVNGDGFGDAVVGLPEGKATSSSYPTVVVFYGSAAGLTATKTAIVGSSSMGGVVVGIGDLDGDGYDDIAAALDVDYMPLSGEVQVYRGSASGTETTPFATFSPPSTGASFGSSISGGDVNGDGYSDLLIGAPDDDTAAYEAGIVYLFYGSAAGFAATADWSYSGIAGDACGTSVDARGDEDGDGFADVLVGCGMDSSTAVGAGSIRLFRGSAAGLGASPDTVSETGVAYDAVGWNTVWAGDLDGDGHPDAATSNGVDDGGLEWFRGDGAGLESSEVEALRPDGNLAFGGYLGAPGDVDGDGLADLVVGSEVGDMWFLPGGPTLSWSYDCDWSADGSMLNDWFGYWVDHGDINGDGIDDLLVGRADGAASVYAGSATGPVYWGSVPASGDAGGSGDWNGDGYDDVAIINEGSSAGRLSFYAGGAGAVGSEIFIDALSSDHEDPSMVTNGGDIDGDSIDDLLVGTEGGPHGHGEVLIWFGTTGTFSASADWTVEGTTTLDDFGARVAGLGDLDGDGLADIAATSASADDLYPDGGEVAVFYGAAGGPATTADFTWSSGDDDGTCYVGHVGDVDGDGYDELVVGSQLDATLATNAGRVDIFAGGPGGVGSTPTQTVYGEVADGFFGRELTGPGDVDGDGHADLLTGGDGNDPIMLLLGSASGLESEVARTYDVDHNSHGAAGDINDDGFDDVVIGDTSVTDSTGKARVFYGGALDRDADGFDSSVDCADTDATAYPGAAELCDGVDNDCNGVVDDSAPSWYPDEDADGYGDDARVSHDCTQPEEWIDVGGDCDDSDATSSPAGAEACGGGDEDCDGATDEAGALGGVAAWTDADGDGYGAGSSVALCTIGVGFAAVDGDCDDGRASVSPAAAELCGGGDENCDSTLDVGAVDPVAWYDDADGDTHGAGDATWGCTAPAGFVGDASDCDDARADVWPGAEETCDGADQDCDHAVDEDATDAMAWYVDADGDGHGAGAATLACTAPEGSVGSADDCLDTDAGSYPGATEVWYDGRDEACDGGSDYDRDADGVDASSFGGTDCDDSSAAVHPAATEIWYDGIDQDCDGNDDDQDFDGLSIDADCDDTDPTVGAECDSGGDTSTDSATEDTAPPLDSDTGDLKADSPAGCGCAHGTSPSALGIFGIAAMVRRRVRARATGDRPRAG